ncbi:MAG: ABC transporter substrate-binding protein, partial [Propionibacteriales bacterium]|nr:ABC transporter substrate-binding protein [Propionibacteriales bacterium]
MNTWRKRAARIVTAVTVASLVAACGAGGRSDDKKDGGQASDVGITDDTITIGAHFPLTGVAAPGYSEIPTGAQAYFDYVNANGGVDGRKIKYIVRDDGYNPTNTSQVTNELVLKDEIFAMVGGLGTPTHSAVVDFLNSEKVPDMFVSSGSLQWGDDPGSAPYTFGWQPDYESEGKIIGRWVAENMPDARVGLFLQDDDLGTDSEKGIRQFLDKQIVAVEKYTSGNTDVAPQIAALAADKVDMVLGFNTPSYTALSQL